MQKLNRNHLKLIACLTMLVDHIGYVLHLKGAAFIVTRAIIGRIAFPLFGYLLVEGLFHTRSRAKYLLRILLLGLISEVPYDLLFYRRTFYWKNQNILFLLALGLLMLVGLEYVRSRESMNARVALLLQIAFVADAAAVAWFFRLDYDIAGIVMLAAMYYYRIYCGSYPRSENAAILRRCSFNAVLLGAIALNTAQLFIGTATPGALLAAVPAFFYNERRGKLRAKYAFYLFYPVHILLLLLILRR